MAETDPDLQRTALYDLHKRLGATLVPFAGYEMPVQYAEGVKAEHLWTRAEAGLFDVAHMGPATFRFRDGAGPETAEARFAALAERVERIVPSNIAGLKPGRLRYTVLLTEQGTIADDFFLGHPKPGPWAGRLYVVANAAVKEADFARLGAALGEDVCLDRLDTTHTLVALQGPKAEPVLETHIPGVADLRFMDFAVFEPAGTPLTVSRSGYTGEDGFEILIPNGEAVAFCERLLDDGRVKPIGLGARDSLRLEAGLCLYGHDMDTTRDPVEAGLAWVIQKVRRERRDFAGAERILGALDSGPRACRVGLKPLERAPAREGTEIARDGEAVGVVTSGGFGPSYGGPVAMGYVRADLATPGTQVDLMVRGKARPAEIVTLPFIEPCYKR